MLLLDIETDKVVIEIFAPVDGVLLEILKEEGDVVESEELLGRLEEGIAAPTEVAVGGATVARAPAQDVPASPAARKLAAEQGIDLAVVAGTGKGGACDEGRRRPCGRSAAGRAVGRSAGNGTGRRKTGARRAGV